MTDELTDPELAAAYAALNKHRKALHLAWVLIGRLDATLEALESPRLSAHGRREIIQKMRAEVLHAMGSAE